MKKIFLNLVLLVGSLLVCGLVLELGTRAVAMFHTPSWADKQKEFMDRFAVPFSYGLVRPHLFIPDLRRYFPSGEQQADAISIRTNRFGMRMREVEIVKSPDTLRIAAMGDSCTFGWMVSEEYSYARVLETVLNRSGEMKFEVLNFGIPGYTSYHGLLQYRNLVKQFQPDLLLIAYGFNDSYDFRFSEKEFHERLARQNLVEGLRTIPLFFYDHSAFAHWTIQRLKSFGKNAVEEELQQRAAQNIWHPRVDRESYQANLREMIRETRSSGGQAIVLNLDLPNTWVKKSVRTIAEEMQIETLDVQDLFAQNVPVDPPLVRIRQTLSGEGIQSATRNPRSTLLFRVWVPEKVETGKGVHLLLNAVNHDWPWQLPMFDDGSHGDEKAGDRVWSCQMDLDSVNVEPGEWLDYAFVDQPLPTQQPFYENSDKALRFYHAVHVESIPLGAVWNSPIHAFDAIPFVRLMVSGDVIHPNREGHVLIAAKLMEMVKKTVARKNAIEKTAPETNGMQSTME